MRQMSGARAELLSYALYQDWKNTDLSDRLAPLKLVDYRYVSNSVFEFQLLLTFVRQLLTADERSNPITRAGSAPR